MAVRSGGGSSSSSSVRSLPPPCPKSPPEYPDLYGKRREAAKIQMLEREISVLEEELKSVDGLQPASRYCKEVTDFVMAKSDPLIPTVVKVVYATAAHAFATYVTAGPANVARRTAVHANAALLTRVHASATHVIAVCVSAAPATAVHVSAAACATAVHVSAAACATAVHVSAALVIAFRVTAARATAAHVQTAAQYQNGDVNAAHATVAHVQAAAQSRNCNASAAHATAAHVQAAAQSRNGNVSCVLNPIASERSHAAAGTVAFFNSLRAQIAFAANGNVLHLNVQRQTFAAIVQKPVVILAAYYSNIFLHFRADSSIGHQFLLKY
ncbi:hypothetical protein V6N13_139568 [Hibiscus sabdariffa]|uniref:G protein gamma domain-containing protein n=1 Tax=Hibiscus sabdariffa TaxID=183260 RepID=A0ABR2C7R0_9ROSI